MTYQEGIYAIVNRNKTVIFDWCYSRQEAEERIQYWVAIGDTAEGAMTVQRFIAADD